jgi:hypothetical protein
MPGHVFADEYGRADRHPCLFIHDRLLKRIEGKESLPAPWNGHALAGP